MWNFLGPAQRIAQSNPWLKWAVIVLVGLFALEFIAQRGIGLYRDLATVKSQTKATNATNEYEAVSKNQRREVANERAMTPEESRATVCGSEKGRELLGEKYGCPAN